jgi:hypothetical protein
VVNVTISTYDWATLPYDQKVQQTKLAGRHA